MVEPYIVLCDSKTGLTRSFIVEVVQIFESSVQIMPPYFQLHFKTQRFKVDYYQIIYKKNKTVRLAAE